MVDPRASEGSHMMEFAWRWAQVGDRVQVHHHDAPYTLMPGVVSRVRRFPDQTDVAIRLDDEHAARRFARQYVHSDPKDPAEACPLCQLQAARRPNAAV